MAQSSVTLKAVGLNYSPNQLSAPEGSLSIANDVIIRRDGVIESRRGYLEYTAGVGSSVETAKQLMQYKNRVLMHIGTDLFFDSGTLDANGKAIFSQFAGVYNEALAGRRIRYIESNKNLYFTSDSGIQKISAKSASDFSTASGFITQAGAYPALDFTANLLISQGQNSGFMTPDSTVAYRHIWGYKDLNNNLVLGAPSNRVIVYNYLQNIIAMDLNAFALMMDNLNQSTSLFTYGSYFSSFAVSQTSDIATMQANVISMAERMDQDLHYASIGTPTLPLVVSSIKVAGNICTITCSSGNPSNYLAINDKINITNLTNTNPVTLGDASTPTSYPLQMSAIQLTSNVATITFSVGDPSQYFKEGDQFSLASLAPAGLAALNGTHTVDYAPTSNSIRFNYNNPDIVSTAPTAGTLQKPGATVGMLNGIHTLDYTPTNTEIKFTFTTQDIAPFTPTAGDINSYKYTDIVKSGDTTYTTALSDVQVSTPATSEQESIIENTILRLHQKLLLEPIAAVPATLMTTYINAYNTTQLGEAELKITIPEDIIGNSNYFLQVYRTQLFEATGAQSLGQNGGVEVIPDDEMRLVYEYFPTSTDFSNKYITFVDDNPVSLVQNNTNLYTNPVSGEGINQSNYMPPYAIDVNRYKNYIFYANTRTNHILTPMQLLGTTLINDGDVLTITNGTSTQTYTFTLGVAEKTDFAFSGTAAQLKTGLQDKYATVNSAEDFKKYYVWFRYDNAGTDPAPANLTRVIVDLLTGDTSSVIASKFAKAINSLIYDFSATVATSTVSVTNIDVGVTSNATAGNTTGSRLTVTVITDGKGEDAASNKVLLSNITIAGSPSLAIDETAQSLVRIINKNASSIVNAYYISNENTTPGQFYLQAKSIADVTFYVLGSTTNLGKSFNPDIGPDRTDVTSIVPGVSTTTITTTSPHGLATGSQIVLTNTGAANVNGLYTITSTGSTTFTIPVVAGASSTTGSFSILADCVYSSNEAKPNRVFYSKVGQPDAVPLVNYLDVGAEDKNILRIFPLRDSLFVFKEDGLYRISGEIAPFVVQLFDTSCELVAPDSVSVANNIIYAWTQKGITNVTETGTYEISRPVDIEILRLSSSEFPNFSTVTWGVGYDSDNSYTVYTNSQTSDAVATIAFRYCNLTNTWTNFIRSQTCGLILKSDDKMYMGSGTANLIHQERKSFTREDYADKDFPLTLDDGTIQSNGTLLTFTSVSGIYIGDVITQDQTVTIYNYNALLAMLDTEPSLAGNYTSTLQASTGNDMKLKLDDLAAKLNADPGTNTKTYAGAASNDFTVLKNAYNAIITKLNADTGLVIKTYQPITYNTLMEAVVTDVNYHLNQITVNLPLQFIVGAVRIYNSIECSFIYSPHTFGDPLMLKQIYQATFMFSDKAFTQATALFASDLFPSYNEQIFYGDGNGIFGHYPNKGFGYGYFGGASNAVPFRTYVPRDNQRCRFLQVGLNHKVAREKIIIYGITLTGNTGQSDRAYRS